MTLREAVSLCGEWWFRTGPKAVGDQQRWYETHLSGRLDGGYDPAYVIPSDLVENGNLVRKDLPTDDPRTEQNLREFLRQLRKHLKEKGWLSRYVQHIHDEPHGTEMPVYRRFVYIVSEELPGVPTLDAISLHEDIPAEW